MAGVNATECLHCKSPATRRDMQGSTPRDSIKNLKNRSAKRSALFQEPVQVYQVCACSHPAHAATQQTKPCGMQRTSPTDRVTMKRMMNQYETPSDIQNGDNPEINAPKRIMV